MGNKLLITTCTCTTLFVLGAIASLVLTIILRIPDGDRDWDCEEDSPGAELANEGIYECPDGNGGTRLGVSPAIKFFFFIFLILTGIGVSTSIACGICFVCHLKDWRRRKELKEFEEGVCAPTGQAAKGDPNKEFLTAASPDNMV